MKTTDEIPPQIVNPCPISWSGMEGNAKRRFCEHCQMHVHNLSEMSACERKRLLDSAGPKCVTYRADSRGRLLTRSTPWEGWFSRLRAAAIATIATVLPLQISLAARPTMGRAIAPTDEEKSSPTPTPTPPQLPVPGDIMPRGEVVCPPTPTPK